MLFLVSSSSQIDRSIVMILLEPLKREFHVSDTALGLLTGIAFGLFYTFLGIPIARWSDRGDRRLIITLSVALWSVMTAACGLARSFFQLFLLRIGVGVGEAGSGPPVMSLLADYFPPERRARAIGFVLMSGIAGNILGLMAGGYIAQYYGWRITLYCAGLPGILLALVAWAALREPRTRLGFNVPASSGESTMSAFRVLIKKPAFVNITLAMICYWFVAYGALSFGTAYVVRVLHYKLGETGAATGLFAVVYILAGNAAGGSLADRLSKRDIAWLCKLPGYGMMIVFPIFAASFLVPTLFEYVAVGALAGTILVGVLPAIISSLQSVLGAKRRATGYALASMFANLIGLTSGPVVTGMLSDFLARYIGPEQGLRWGIILSLLGFIPTGWFMLRAARTIRTDFEL